MKVESTGPREKSQDEKNPHIISVYAVYETSELTGLKGKESMQIVEEEFIGEENVKLSLDTYDIKPLGGQLK